MTVQDQYFYDLFQHLLDDPDLEAPNLDSSTRTAKEAEEMTTLVDLADRLRYRSTPVVNAEVALSRAKATCFGFNVNCYSDCRVAASCANPEACCPASNSNRPRPLARLFGYLPCASSTSVGDSKHRNPIGSFCFRIYECCIFRQCHAWRCPLSCETCGGGRDYNFDSKLGAEGCSYRGTEPGTSARSWRDY